MSTGARPWRALLPVLRLPGLLLVASLVGAAPTALAQTPDSEPDTPEDNPPTIELLERPAWIAPTDLGRFVVSIEGAAEDAAVRLVLHAPLGSVEDLATSETQGVGRRIFATPVLPLPFLPDGPAPGTAIIGLRSVADPNEDIDAFTTRLTEPGVHPVVLELLDGAGAVVDRVRTPIVALGEDAGPVLDLAVLVDIAADPSLTPDGSRMLDDDDVDRLATTAAFLDAHPSLDLTILAVPDTLDALAAAGPPGAAVLDSLLGRDVIVGPYLPLDITALIGADLIGMLPDALTRASNVVEDLLGAPPREVIWDPVEAPTEAAGRLLADLGIRHALVPSVGVDGTPVWPGPFTSTPLDSLDVIAVDAALSARLARERSAVDAAHHTLAELLIGTEVGDRSLVRAGSLDGTELAGLLDLLDAPSPPIRVGGLDLVTTGDRVDEQPEPERPDATTGLGSIADEVRRALLELAIFEQLVGEGSSRDDDVRLQLLTAVAAGLDTSERRAAAAAATRSLATAFERIGLDGERDLNLTSRRGTLPVTIVNDNPFGIEVVLRIRSDRLRFPEGEMLRLRITEDHQRIDIPVEALATGSVPVFVELWTPDDTRLLDARQLNVRSTAISGVGLVLSAGALAVLILWWIRSWRRARRASRRRHPTVAPDL